MADQNPLDRTQRRFPPLGYPIATVFKFGDDQGAFLAATFAYYAFVSIFPLIILATTVLGVVLEGNSSLQKDLIDSALAEFPIIGDQISAPSASTGSWVSIAVSSIIALYGALGAAQAFQHMANTVWQVPRNSRPNPFAARGKSIGLIAVFGTALFGTVGLTQVVPRVIHLAGLAKFGVQVGTLAVDVAAALLAFRVATSRTVRTLALLPGAVFAGVMWQVLQSVGGLYVEHVVQRNSAVAAGQLAVVVGLVIFLYIVGIVLALAMEIDAVRVLRLWPRSLLTPFTDNVELTAGDIRAYTGLTKSTRLKGFQQINVTFDKSGGIDAPSDQDEELPLEFEGEQRQVEPEPLPPPPTQPLAEREPEPTPESASTPELAPAPEPAPGSHRLPARPPAPDLSQEQTIPLVLGREPHRRVDGQGDDGVDDPGPDRGDDDSVVRGPWSADG